MFLEEKREREREKMKSEERRERNPATLGEVGPTHMPPFW